MFRILNKVKERVFPTEPVAPVYLNSDATEQVIMQAAVLAFRAALESGIATPEEFPAYLFAAQQTFSPETEN